jgi:hypothetical protein
MYAAATAIALAAGAAAYSIASLGTVSLWLGPRFRGHRRPGRGRHRRDQGEDGQSASPRPVRELRLRNREAPGVRPAPSFRELNGPPGGQIFFFEGAEVDVTRGKLLIVARLGDKSFRLDRAAALALIKALRPLSPEA